MNKPVECRRKGDGLELSEWLFRYRRAVRIGATSIVIVTLWTIPALADDMSLSPIRRIETAPLPKPASPTAVRPAHRPAAQSVIHCSGEIEPPSTVNVPLGQSTTFRIDEPIRMRTVGNPGVVQTIQMGANQLYLVGIRIGSTNMMLQGSSGACRAVSVNVSVDPSGLREVLAALMPEEKDIHVSAAADALVLSGQVTDAVQAQRIVELAQRFVTAANPPVSDAPAATHTAAGAATAPPGGGPAAPSAGEADQAKMRVINMLSIAAPQQVMLEVKVAEVSKKLIDELGLNVQLASSHISAAIGALLAFGVTKDNVSLKANADEEPVKILAQPNLMAVSGQKANFLAGGKVFIPIPQSFGAGGMQMITLQEETFGVKLSFLPTVLRDDIINLQVSPEVSELSSIGLKLPAGDGQIPPMPVIDVRSAATTVQLKDGQSFAIGGLLSDSARAEISAFPGLGEIPILGALFRSTRYQSNKTELIFIVTPHLVKPLPTTYPLPTDTFGKVDRWTVRTTGNIEGVPPKAELPQGEKRGMGTVPPLSDSGATEQSAQSRTPTAPTQSGASGEVPAVPPGDGVTVEPKITGVVSAPPAQ